MVENTDRIATSKSSRQKKYHIKVKTGCKTCRNRRVKCDETKPICKKCQRASHSCEGLGYGISRPPVSNTNKQPGTVVNNPQATTVPLESSITLTICAQDLTKGLSNFSSWQIIYRTQLLSKFTERWYAASDSQVLRPEELAVTRWVAPGVVSSYAQKDELGGDAYLFLSLCTMIAQTQNPSLYNAARCIYASILPRLQKNLQSLATNSLRIQLMRDCFACGVGEYIMRSREAFDRHLDGIALIAHTLDSTTILDEESERLVIDHAVALISTSFVHKRCPNPPSPVMKNIFQKSSLGPVGELCLMGYAILPAVQDYRLLDNSGSRIELKRFAKLFAEAYGRFSNWPGTKWRTIPESPPANNGDIDSHQIKIRIRTAAMYRSAYMIQIAWHELDIATKLNVFQKHHECKEKLLHHAQIILDGAEEIVMQQNVGLGAIICFVFPFDSAWVACESINHTSAEVVQRFISIAQRMVVVGIPPYREPWRDIPSNGKSGKTSNLHRLLGFPNVKELSGFSAKHQISKIDASLPSSQASTRQFEKPNIEPDTT